MKEWSFWLEVQTQEKKEESVSVNEIESWSWNEKEKAPKAIESAVLARMWLRLKGEAQLVGCMTGQAFFRTCRAELDVRARPALSACRRCSCSSRRSG